MKKFCVYIITVIALLAPLASFVAFAAPTTEADFFSDNNYELLQPLPDAAGSDVKVQAIDVTDLPSYINTMFLIVIGLGAVLAVLYISYGGIIYMSTDAVTGKKEGKEKIKQALWGLLIIIGCFFILQTINPTILNLTTLGTDSVQTRTVKATDPNNVGKWCIQIFLDGKPFTTDCDTQSTCNARNLTWSKKRFTSTACYVSTAALMREKKECTDITVEGKNYKSGTNADCTAGFAYIENPLPKQICNARMGFYQNENKGYLFPRNCYESGNRFCLDIANSDGTPRNTDCVKSSDPDFIRESARLEWTRQPQYRTDEAYIKDSNALQLCEDKRAKYWNVTNPFTASPCQLQK